jgi:4-amino-4-deoxy-L-arabinose transferase-like glycosyltransferase
LFGSSARRRTVPSARFDHGQSPQLSAVKIAAVVPIRPEPGLLRARLITAGLLAVFVIQCGWFIRTQSFTFDEPVHIAEGLEAWRHHKFEMWNDHPPLARLWCTLPLLSSKFQIHAQPLENGNPVDSVTPDPQTMARRARSMNVILGLLLAWLVWDVSRRILSLSAANFALALLVFSPPILAHYSLVTTDGAATLLIFAVAASLLRWRGRFTARRILLFGFLLGLLLLSKFSTPVMFVLAVLWILLPAVEPWHNTFRRLNWRLAVSVTVLAAVTVWAGYFFHVSNVTVNRGRLQATFPNRADFEKRVPSFLQAKFVLPAGEYFDGLHSVVRHNRLGQPAFFLGQVSKEGGIKSFYPAAIALKWPAGTVMLSLLGIFFFVRWRFLDPGDFWLFVSFPAVYFLFAIFARLNIGDRHILPIYPFLVVFAAAVWQAAKVRRGLIAILVLLVALQAFDTLRYAPDYLSYFNFYVPKTQTYRFLTDSNLDWGQSLLSVKDYEARHPGENIWLAYFGSVEPSVYGIHARPLPPGEKVSGTVLVSATALSGQYLAQPDGYRWLLQHPRTAILDHAMQVFDVSSSGDMQASSGGKPVK